MLKQTESERLHFSGEILLASALPQLR